MSNVEIAPQELTCVNAPADQAGNGVLLASREVPLGGPRAMTVRRTLPQRTRSLIGAWCFIDHYGPNDVSVTGGMRVDGHPHTGLQTVSWLFSGEVEHWDTIGTHALVRPGEINLMTAGAGVAHSEYSTSNTATLHGAQLWIALPDKDRFINPSFQHYAPPVINNDDAQVRVFLGALLGEVSPLHTFTSLLGAEITLQPKQSLQLEVEPAYEHGVLVDTGELAAAGVNASSGQLIYCPPGTRILTLHACSTESVRVLLLGGEPLNEHIVMWWNFIARTHEEILSFRDQWEVERSQQTRDQPKHYGQFPRSWEHTLPAPVLPNVRLKPR